MEFKNIPVNAIRENKLNPNVMSENKFNFLVQNIQENGFIEPIAVVEVEPDVYEV